MTVKIITDSTSEISQTEAQKADVALVPIKTIFADREYREGIDLTADEFYQKLEAAEELPTTSQPSPGDFETAYRKALIADDTAGDDELPEIVAVTISSKLSGTWQSACLAKEVIAAEDKGKAARIHIVDSESATIGLNILMQRALVLRDRGKSATEIAQALEEAKTKLRLYAVVDTLEYLHKGGRLSSAAKTAGTLLKVKPIIMVEEGEIKIAGKSRGLAKAYDEIFNCVERAGTIDFDQPMALGYTADKTRLDQFIEAGPKYLKDQKPTAHGIGCAIGTHAGPGAVAFAFFVK